jgi:apyrase
MLYRRHETWLDKIVRMRGLSLLVAAPLVIAILFILLFPRFEVRGLLLRCACFSAWHALHCALCRDSLSQLGSSVEGGERYAVVFDAGSTGSRVHVFKFINSASGLLLMEDTFEQLKPGLGDSSWASDPKMAAGSLKPLLKKAEEAVPVSMQASTPVELRATAGLRLLPGTAADKIIDAVTTILENSPFKLVNDGVSVMEGVDEGAFAWLTLNYLLGKTGKPANELVGAVDLGGGSVQQAFAVDDEIAADAPEGGLPVAVLALQRQSCQSCCASVHGRS